MDDSLVLRMQSETPRMPRNYDIILCDSAQICNSSCFTLIAIRYNVNICDIIDREDEQELYRTQEAGMFVRFSEQSAIAHLNRFSRTKIMAPKRPASRQI